VGKRGVASAVFAALLLGSAASANAATITVNTTSDTYGVHDSHCSLRDAVQAADAQKKFGACPAPAGTD
jgi:CSLREA domain-containing protein